jgi:glucose-6-phosphate 1-dehydrogenase
VTKPAVDPHLFVIFGGTGDLSRKKLIPALHRILVHENLTDRVAVLAVGTRPLTDGEYREMVVDALIDAGTDPEVALEWCTNRFHYQRVDPSSDYDELTNRIEALELEHSLPGNRILYLALGPTVAEAAIGLIADAGLDSSEGWTRIVVEKPFGRDMASAQRLNGTLHRSFDEADIFRIDHYLGKETVRNLLVFRFANALFERTWNRDHIETIEITVAEDVGIEGRERYYDRSGAVRDMVQNHLTQLMTLIAMESPVSTDSDAIRSEKVKVLTSVAPLAPDDVVYGQYDGYTELPGVDAESTTPTYVAIRAQINNWRWQGVSFFLRTGKHLSERSTRILVTYRQPPVCIFHSDCAGHRNLLLLTLQPEEGFDLYFDVKEPGADIAIAQTPLSMRYDDHLGRLADAYATLLHDVMQGDQVLFVRSDEVETSWRHYADVLDPDSVESYEPGTWGPQAAENLVAAVGATWSEQTVS